MASGPGGMGSLNATGAGADTGAADAGRLVLPDNLITKGFMRKRGHIRKNWKTRFFQLYIEDELILYFASAAHKWNKSKAKGKIALSGASLDKVPTKRFKKTHVFKVTTAKGVDYYMEAPTETDRDAWMETISYIIKGHGALTGESLDLVPESIEALEIVDPESLAGSGVGAGAGSAAGAGPSDGGANGSETDPSLILPSVLGAASGSNGSGGGTAAAAAAGGLAPGGLAPGGLAPGGRSRTGRSALSEYQTVKIVGMGAFAKVILVRKRSTGEYFAMKVIPKSRLRHNKHLVETQRTERNVLARVDHPFIVRLHHAFQSKDKLYLVLDFINGGEVFFHLNEEGSFPESRVRFYVAQMALAIGHLHSLGVLYRDLKPENVLLDADGFIRLTDFGISKDTAETGGRTASFCGTPNYMAPEIVGGGSYGRAVDWWCLGILMFEMLVGRPPFMLAASDTNDMIFERIVHATKSDVTVPFAVSEQAQDFLYRILDVSQSTRLGSSKADVDDIKAHPFFAGLDWDALLAKAIPPQFVPSVVSPEDLSNIDPEFVNKTITTDDQHCVSIAPGAVDSFAGFTYAPDNGGS